MGTTHADYFYGDIPCTRSLSKEEIEGEYEKNTGLVIVETFRNINPVYIPGVLVEDHAPFSWGKNAGEAVHNSVVMEEVAKMALNTLLLSGGVNNEVNQYLLDKHFMRKHGENAYYGQK
jgi:L-ribulose-5-phosphate 4-epimerase